MIQTVGLWRGLNAVIYTEQSAPSQRPILAIMRNGKAALQILIITHMRHILSVQKCTN